MLKKIYAALFAVTMITITLSTSVYAWFSVTRTGMIEGIELGVGLDDDLWISLDGINYYKEITNEMMVAYIGESPVLHSITSQNGIDFFHGPISYQHRAVPRYDYIAFDVYFKVVTDNPNTDAHHRFIYLSDKKSPTFDQAATTSGTFVTSRGKNWISPIEFDDGDIYVTAGMNRLYYGHNAVRISSVNEEQNLNFVYDISENETRGFGKTFGAQDYYEKRLGITLNIPQAPSNMIYGLTQYSPLQNDIALDQTSLLSEVSLVNEIDGIYEYRGQTKISIWLEGWDADCFDAIFEDLMYIQLRFKAARYYD